MKTALLSAAMLAAYLLSVGPGSARNCAGDAVWCDIRGQHVKICGGMARCKAIQQRNNQDKAKKGK